MQRPLALILLAISSLEADESQWEKHFSAGEALLRQAGDYVGAARELDLALIQAEALGPQDAVLPVTLTNRAVVDVRLGRYRDAERRYLRAIAIYETYHPNLRSSLAGTLQDYAVLKVQERQPTAAGKLYRRANDLLVSSVGPKDPAVAKNLSAMAELALETHGYGEAEKLFLEARPNLRDPLDLANLDHNLAMLYRETGRSAKSGEPFDRAIAAYQRAAPQHANLAVLLRNYAEFQSDRGNLSVAEQSFRQALQICEASLNPDSPQTGIILQAYGRFLAKTKRAREAKLIAQRARRILSQSFQERQGDQVVDWRDLKEK